MIRNLFRCLRYDWPLHCVLLLTQFLPDNVLCFRLRGFLARRFIRSGGRNLRLGRNILLFNPGNIKFGRDTYLAYGAVIIANDIVTLGNEVMISPYCVLASGNHTRQGGSYRYGVIHNAPINIGDGCWLGSHVVVTAGVTIGAGTAIGGGAVVTKSIAAGQLAAGVPASVIKAISEITY